MRGIVKGNYNFMFLTTDTVEYGVADVIADDLITFDDGDEVEILRVIENVEAWVSNVAYVVFNPKNGESITLDSSLVELINE